MTDLSLAVFGGFGLSSSGGEPIVLRHKRAQALLVYLAMHAGQEMRRDKIASLFWSRSDDEHARQSLRQIVRELRRSPILGGHAGLTVTAEEIGLDSVNLNFDVAAFRELAAVDSLEALESAATLYRGDFLDGFELNEPSFEEWLMEERRDLRKTVLEVMLKLLDRYMTDGAPVLSMRIAKRILTFDRCHEIAHRAIMRLLALQGRRAEAIEQYRECDEAIRSELGVEPEDVTKSLYQEILESADAVPIDNTEGATASTSTLKGREKRGRSSRIGIARLAFGSTLAAFAIVAAVLLGQNYSEPKDGEKLIENPASEISSGPSIAVLPFVDLSADAGQEYFIDGLTADLITALAGVRNLRVLAEHRTVGMELDKVSRFDLGRELGVRFVVVGSVRRDTDHIRINVQLVDLEDGSHIWAERYDRDFAEIFVVQDDIVARVVGSIASSYFGALEFRLAESSATKSPASLEAYDLLLRARHALWNDFSQGGYRDAVWVLNQALELDPAYGKAHRELAWFTLIGWIFRFDDSIDLPSPVIENAIKSGRLDPSNAHTRRVAAYGLFFDKQLDRFWQEAKTALNMAPYDADIIASIAMVYGFLGEWDEGVSLARKANALDELSASGWYHTTLYYDYYLKGEYEAAIEIIAAHPNQNLAETAVKYVMAYGAMGDSKRALEYWRYCLEIESDFSPQKWIDILRLWNFREHDIESLMAGIYAAGIPMPQAALADYPSVRGR